MTTAKNKGNWEKEFDILSSSLGCDGEQMDELRDFIRKTLFSQKKECIKSIEKEKLNSIDKFYGKSEIEYGFETTFNDGLSKAISIIKDLKNH